MKIDDFMNEEKKYCFGTYGIKVLQGGDGDNLVIYPAESVNNTWKCNFRFSMVVPKDIIVAVEKIGICACCNSETVPVVRLCIKEGATLNAKESVETIGRIKEKSSATQKWAVYPNAYCREEPNYRVFSHFVYSQSEADYWNSTRCGAADPA